MEKLKPMLMLTSKKEKRLKRVIKGLKLVMRVIVGKIVIQLALKTYRGLQFSAQRVVGLQFVNKGDKMKKILIKHTVQIDDDDYDRFCNKLRIGIRDCHHLFQDDFIAAGERAIRKRMQEEV